MEPVYLAEKRYSYHVFSWRRPIATDYQPADPQTEFEFKVQQLFVQGFDYLQQEEFYLALNAFRELQNLILTTVHPTLPPDTYLDLDFTVPLDEVMVDVLAGKVADTLGRLPIKRWVLPDGGPPPGDPLPDSVRRALDPFESAGLNVSAAQLAVGSEIDRGIAAARESDWPTASEAFKAALQSVGDDRPDVRASLLHDVAIVSERAGEDPKEAARLVEESSELFARAEIPEAQVESLHTLSGILARSGDPGAAEKAAATAAQLASTKHLFAVDIGDAAPAATLGETATVRLGNGDGPLAGVATRPQALTGLSRVAAPAATRVLRTAAGGDEPAVARQAAQSAELMLDRFWKPTTEERTFQLAGGSAQISLAGDARANVKGYLAELRDTADLRLVHPWTLGYVETAAYIPSMYFFVIPMAIGDCLVGLGDLAGAETSYRSTLVYPYINRRYELVRLWVKLARVYLDMGDAAYRAARDDVSAFGAAKAFYERIVKTDKTLDGSSPLYQDSQFDGIQARVEAFLAAGMHTSHADNPQILTTVMEAALRLHQIASGLNYFGFGADYLPPFNWEYLQTTAKYFAQQASQIEQRYIQFKSQAENETLQRTQLDQQAEVARQTVVLEERGLAEAQAGVDVANASMGYAETQRSNAEQARDAFASNRDELAEYAELEAWAGASAVDHDDEVQLTITGYSYYNSDHKPRNQVLQDLARQRTQVSYDMEADRLQRDVDAAAAYVGVAQAQGVQAQARVDVAEQRVAIANLQQRDAEENRDFLDMKEFNARLWYDLARESRRLSRKYLEMATEIAFLTERAYNAETERGVRIIRYDYSHSAADNLMGGDFLALDLDSFTFDYLVTSKTRKAPVKQVLSLADRFPMAFQALRASGSCGFQTELAMFDRMNPGLYLAKVRNVELVVIGVSNASLSGTLRNVGVSRFRLGDGSIVSRLYPADVMPLSQYEIRADALAFRVDPKDLRLFENNGIDTLWRLDLPLDANDFDLAEILDVQLVLYYDAHFSPTIETAVRAALPTTGSATRATSLLMSYPDELFYLKSQGEAELVFDASMFPRNQLDLTRRKLSLRATGAAAAGLKLRLDSQAHGSQLVLTTDANGEVDGIAAGSPLAPLQGEPVFDSWKIAIDAADNPALAPGGVLDLSGVSDLMVFVEYDFNYR